MKRPPGGRASHICARMNKKTRKFIFVALGFITLLAVLAFITTQLYQPAFLVHLVQQATPDITFEVRTGDPVFALTFDDGPNPPCTDRVLEILEKYDVRATFFLIGNRIESHPEYLEKYLSGGHQVANHLYEDSPALFQGEPEFIQSLERTEALIQQKTESRLCRPPSGWARSGQLRAARERGFTVVMASAYVYDPRNPSQTYMLAALKVMLRPGVIVVLHDGGAGGEGVVEMLPALLDYARAKNLKSVTIEELLNRRG